MSSFNGFIISDVQHDRAVVLPDWLDEPIPFNRHPASLLQDIIAHGLVTETHVLVEDPHNFGGKVVPSFSMEFYNRVLIEPAFIDAGNVVSEQVRTLSIFNGFFTSVTIEDIVTNNADGITLDGVPTPSVLLPLGTRIATLRIGTEGPPDIDAQFKFSFDSYRDLFVAITGSRVIALPYQVEAGFKEVLEWRTEVLTSNDGSEQRIQHRFKPRQEFSGNYHVPADQLARADNILYGWIGQRWAVPVWSESQLVGAASGNEIPCLTGTTDIRISGLVMIWESPTKYEVIEVVDIGFASVTLARPLNNSYVRALLMPLRSGLGGGTGAIKKNGITGKISMSFDILDNIQLFDSAPAQYLGEDVYFDNTLMGEEGLTDKYTARVDMVDYGAVRETFLPWINRKIGRSTFFLLEDSQTMWTFRKWLHRRAGKLKPYWLPTFENNFRLDMTGPVSSSLIVKNDDFKGLGDKRIHLAIQYNDNTWQIRTITGVSVVDGDTSAIGLNTPLNVDATFVKMVCYLGLKRLDTDSVTIEWVGGGVATSSIGILEILP